jgi:hypothetical protein
MFILDFMNWIGGLAEHSHYMKHGCHGLLSYNRTNITSFIHGVVLNSSGKYFKKLSDNFLIYDVSLKTDLLYQSLDALDCKLPPLRIIVFFRDAAIELDDF